MIRRWRFDKEWKALDYYYKAIRKAEEKGYKPIDILGEADFYQYFTKPFNGRENMRVLVKIEHPNQKRDYYEVTYIEDTDSHFHNMIY